MKLSKEAERIISEWAADDYYTYIRPITSTYTKPNKPHKVVWAVAVEMRAVEYQRWHDDGDDLDEVIRSLGEVVPRRKTIQKGYKPAGKKGRPSHLGPFAPAGPLRTNDMIEDDVKAKREAKKSKGKKKKSKK